MARQESERIFSFHAHFSQLAESCGGWFGIMTRKALRGASFKDVTELRKGIEAFILAYHPTAKPFKWGKREGKAHTLRNAISNLYK